jgi:hypothetical protein
MKKSIVAKNKAASAPVRLHDIGSLLASLREVIQSSRQQVLRAVDVVQVRTCWAVGGILSNMSRVEKRAPNTAPSCCRDWRNG